MVEDGQEGHLDLDIELIESSLLPDESISRITGGIEIRSTASKLVLHISTSDYPQRVGIEVKGSEVGRDEAEGWKVWVEERMREWNAYEEYDHLTSSKR